MFRIDPNVVFTQERETAIIRKCTPLKPNLYHIDYMTTFALILSIIGIKLHEARAKSIRKQIINILNGILVSSDELQ